MANKTITMTYNGNKYTLEFTRKTIETMERQGFVADNIGEKPMSTLPVLFAGAFLSRHKTVSRETINAMFDTITNKSDFIQKLAEMYSEPLEVLLSEPEESEGNAVWEASWE